MTSRPDADALLGVVRAKPCDTRAAPMDALLPNKPGNAEVVRREDQCATVAGRCGEVDGGLDSCRVIRNAVAYRAEVLDVHPTR